VDRNPPEPVDARSAPAAVRPQTLLLTFLGEYLLGRETCVYSGSIIDVLGKLEISEYATRSTLTRMVNRGLLRRQRQGQRMYFGLTDRSARILEDGQQRLWKTPAINADWDGQWTVLGFSLPGSWQRERHGLRSQLSWAGFGPLQGGLWIAPATPDVGQIVASLGLESHVRIFRAHADSMTDVDQMVRDAYDLDGLAARYEDFLGRWTVAGGSAALDDPLATKLRLVADWLHVIRRDPRIPARHLPAGWPAARAHERFHRLDAQLSPGAYSEAARLVDTVPTRHAG
jgi:phenylacetic acid degradation operon negative regulatory protein